MATTDTKRYAAKVTRRLGRQYPDAQCSLGSRTPLDLLVATILSAQCTDQRVNLVTKELFRKYHTAADYANSPVHQLEREIQSTGFFRNKAKNINGACKALVEKHGGEVPNEIDTLTQLPGVGRKTANVVLGTAFGIASGIVVDTHVARVSRRLGLTRQKNPEKIEQDLMANIPKTQWIALSHRMIQHGRRYCTARKPKCDECPLAEVCPRVGVDAT
ncbi:MAG: endonuclease III [Planctomycetes bacterium RBG_13_63_9]|nr:MAG: endonuclease III [Planctomycetes bacterium RBG_13_63_9]